MKKRLTNLLTVFSVLFAFLAPMASVGAADVFQDICEDTPNASACIDNTVDQTHEQNRLYGERGVLTRAAQLIAYIVGVASVITIIIGGFKYITSSGDANNIKSAKDTILFAIVGLLVAVSVQSIVLLVLERL